VAKDPDELVTLTLPRKHMEALRFLIRKLSFGEVYLVRSVQGPRAKNALVLDQDQTEALASITQQREP
jgi:hypothetical protein